MSLNALSLNADVVYHIPIVVELVLFFLIFLNIAKRKYLRRLKIASGLIEGCWRKLNDHG